MDKYIYIGNGGSGIVFATYWEIISSASGTVSIPSGGSIKQDAFQDLEDAVVSTVTSGQPTFNAALSTSGDRVVASLDTGGNFSLSPEPDAYPVAIIFRVIVPEYAIDYNSDNLVLEDLERPGAGGSYTGLNLGSGAAVFKQLSGSQFQFRTLVEGANVTITENAHTIEISASGSGGGGNTYFPGGW